MLQEKDKTMKFLGRPDLFWETLGPLPRVLAMGVWLAGGVGGDFVNRYFSDSDIPAETLSRYGREPASKVFRGWELRRNNIAF